MSTPSTSSPTVASWTRLSNSVYELHKPTGPPQLDILFFHGLQTPDDQSDAFFSTWRSGDSERDVWPMSWIPEEFPTARVFSVTYDACIITTAERGRYDLHNMAESLMHDIVHAEIGRQFPMRQVILVGHSFGGLVIKQLCLHAHRSEGLQRGKERMASFHNCIKGIFFYGTPHHGMVSFFNSGKSTSLIIASPLMDYVKVLSAESARLHEEFDVLRKLNGWLIAGVGESRATTWGSFTELIVPESSARYGDFSMADEDHISLCKPKSRTSNTYIRLTAFISRACDEALGTKRRHGNLQTVPKMAMTLQSGVVDKILQSLATAPVIGLGGMGGIGKTTLAKLLFNELCIHFEYTCFVPDVKLTAGDTDSLNNRIKKCMHYCGKRMTGHDWDWDDHYDKAFCIVLVDIENDSHLGILEHIQSMNICNNSRYIVTSRNWDVLNRLYSPIFNVPKLSEECSKALFMSYAFPKELVTSPQLIGYIDKIIIKSDGLPLTLEVMGKYLFRKSSENIWKQCLQALDEADSVASLDERLWTKLKVSYDHLGCKEKEMFLDSACFFCNSRWKLKHAMASWRVVYGKEELRWQRLVDMSLVYEVGTDETIQMHEQLRCLGIRLASGWGTSGISRTWTKNDIPSRLRTLQYGERTAQVDVHSEDTDSSRGLQPLSIEMATHIQEIRALKLDNLMPLSWTDIGQMKRLQYLDSEKSLEVDVGSKVPESVALLRLCGDMDNLVQIIDPVSAGRLAVLDLNAPVRLLPTNFGHLQNLQILNFTGCRFESLPESFVQLTNLQQLELLNCSELTSLPASFGRLSQLQILALWCPALYISPSFFEELSQLEVLALATEGLRRQPSESLVEVPDMPYPTISAYQAQNDGHECTASRSTELFSESNTFEGPTNVQQELRDGANISSLPDTIGACTQLKSLLIYRHVKLHGLPNTFGRLCQLVSLQICYCPSLEALPDSFGQLSCLEELQLEGLPNLRALTNSFGQVKELQSLIIRTCGGLLNLPESFGDLTSLFSFELTSCSVLLSLPNSFGNLQNLRALLVLNTPLAGLPGTFDHLTSLQYLCLIGVGFETLLDSIRQLPSLKEVEFNPYF